MDVPDQDRLATSATPERTKVVLVGTLAAVVAVVASFVSRPVEASETAGYLALLTALFSVRVVGQVAVAVARPRWLPAMEQWNFVSYRILLPTQIALLAHDEAVGAEMDLTSRPAHHFGGQLLQALLERGAGLHRHGPDAVGALAPAGAGVEHAS